MAKEAFHSRVRITLSGAFSVPQKKSSLACLPVKTGKYLGRIMSLISHKPTKPETHQSPLYTKITLTHLNSCREAFAKLAGLGGPETTSKTVTVQELFPWSGAESGTGPYNRLKGNLL